MCNPFMDLRKIMIINKCIILHYIFNTLPVSVAIPIVPYWANPTESQLALLAVSTWVGNASRLVCEVSEGVTV